MGEEILRDENFVLMHGDDGTTSIKVVSASVSGDAQAYNIRGKPRLGFEFTVKLSWKGTFKGEEVAGDLAINDLDSSDIDGFELKPTGKAGNAAAKTCADALKKGAKASIKAATTKLSEKMLV